MWDLVKIPPNNIRSLIEVFVRALVVVFTTEVYAVADQKASTFGAIAAVCSMSSIPKHSVHIICPLLPLPDIYTHPRITLS